MAITDPYRVLGVSPAAEEDVIRAAYLALMKRYHPDQNQSAQAAERAKEVAAAYAMLSDPNRRPQPAGQGLPPRAALAATWAGPRPARGRVGGLLLVLFSALLILFAWRQLPQPSASSRPPPPEQAEPPGEPPLVPQELTAPVPAAEMAEPPPVADLPEVVVPPVDAILLPKEPVSRPPRARPAGAEQRPPQAAAPAISLPPPAGTEIDIPALERHHDLLFSQSLRNADPGREARLIGSAQGFAARLGSCVSATCKRDAYLDRNREIAEIMRR